MQEKTLKVFDGSKWRKAVELECEYCKKKYLHREDRAKRSRFCSKECKLEYNNNQFTLKCHCCGKLFQRQVSKAYSGKHGFCFCSRECKDKSQSLSGNGEGFRPKKMGEREKPCAICGNLSRNKYCSDDCRAEGMNQLAHAFVKNLTLKDFSGTNTAKYRKIREKALQRYNKKKNGICQATGYDKHVEVCHIISLSKFNDITPIEMMNDSRNIILLCPNSHWEFDHNLLPLESISKKVKEEFEQYKQECINAGYLN
jgi:hypothetical protein